MKKAKIPRESQQKAKKHKKSCGRATIATVPRPPLPRPPPAARLPCVANPTLRALLGHPQSYYSSLPEYSILASFSLRREKVGQSCPTVGQDLLRARTQQDEALTPSRCLSLSAGLATSTLVLGMCTRCLILLNRVVFLIVTNSVRVGADSPEAVHVPVEDGRDVLVAREQDAERAQQAHGGKKEDHERGPPQPVDDPLQS